MSRKVIKLSDIGDFIKRRRLELPGDTAAGHMTQKELGQKLEKYGVKARKDTTVAGWEAGYNVPLTVIPALAQVLEVSPLRLYALAGALNDIPASDLLVWIEKAGLTDKEISDAIELLKMYFKKSS